jgi:uncharacterized protein (TIGR03435 family)
MQELADMELLRQYAEQNSETAFAELVTRHVSLVYSAALRKTENSSAAEDVTQAVFVILAQKAGALRGQTVLSGWLYQVARLTAANYLRTEIRRVRREQEGSMQSLSNGPGTEIWPQIQPLLEDAMGRLGERERNAIVLRYFEGKSFQEIGEAEGASENAAKKRLARALEKLHRFFTKRGISSTTAIIAGEISANSVQVAPVALAKTVTAVALAKGAAASISTLTLVKGALKIMAWTKAKTAIAVGIGILLAAGTTSVTIKKIQEHEADNSWRVPGFDSRVLDRISPQVKILPSTIRSAAWGSGQHGKKMGTGVTVNSILLSAYDWWHPARIITVSEEPPGRYDFVASLPSGNAEALMEEIKRKFGIVARREMVETNAFLLAVKYPNTPGLKRSSDQSGNGESIKSGLGRLSCQDVTSSDLAANLEEYVKMPIIDQTSLSQRFDVNITWFQSNWKDSRLDALKQALVDQLGLELVPTNMPIEMLVVEKAK